MIFSTDVNVEGMSGTTALDGVNRATRARSRLPSFVKFTAAAALLLAGCTSREVSDGELGVEEAPTLQSAAALDAADPTPDSAAGSPDLAVAYRTASVDGVDLFYREAGPPDAPTVVLLHGFPTSSHMFRELIPRLADRYHVLAPDYPGFGQSAMPDRNTFAYTFDHLAGIVDDWLVGLHVNRYALYVMDYGGPVGFRIATSHPERVSALIVQNSNAYDDGLGAFWDPFRTYWATPTAANRAVLSGLLTLDITKLQYTFGVSDATRLSPDTWTIDQARLDRPGNVDVQLDLFYDYRTNLALYPTWQSYLHDKHPPTLIVWGQNDPIFETAGATAFLSDVPGAEIHLLDTGHFALEDKGAEIASVMRTFLKHKISKNPPNH
jgi:pimeloyl-ACP methyl ester carboxylesterase